LELGTGFCGVSAAFESEWVYLECGVGDVGVGVGCWGEDERVRGEVTGGGGVVVAVVVVNGDFGPLGIDLMLAPADRSAFPASPEMSTRRTVPAPLRAAKNSASPSDVARWKPPGQSRKPVVAFPASRPPLRMSRAELTEVPR
jgi:hypothetical protein